MKITKIEHFAEYDKEFESDYWSIELKVKGKTIAEFGDWYHDHGREKCEGFIRGVEWALGKKIELEIKRVADAS